jgi:hypothetical protein
MIPLKLWLSRVRMRTRGRTTVWLAVIVAVAMFVTAIPNAWATPNEGPLNQTVPPIPPGPGQPGGGNPQLPPMAAPAPMPYGGFLYYYAYGYGGTPSNYFPGYTPGYYQNPYSYNYQYPSGYWWLAYPVYQGYNYPYGGTYW